MTSSFIYAREAIEEIAKKQFPQFGGYLWSDVVPSNLPPTGTGYTANAWQAVATQIEKAFDKNLLPHPPVKVKSSEKSSAYGKRLVEFQIFLAAKADEKIAKAIVAAF